MSSDEARARRMQRMKERGAQERFRRLPQRLGKPALIGVAVLVVAGSVTAYVYLDGLTPDRVHHHAAWEMWTLDDATGYQNVPFVQPRYDMQATGYMRMHLHVNGGPGSDNIVHLEAAPPFPVSGFMDSLGVTTKGGYVKLDALHENLVYRDNETHRWSLYVQPADGEWRRVASFHRYEVTNGDRVLLTFGNAGEMEASGELARQQASVDTQIPGVESRESGDPPRETGPAADAAASRRR